MLAKVQKSRVTLKLRKMVFYGTDQYCSKRGPSQVGDSGGGLFNNSYDFRHENTHGTQMGPIGQKRGDMYPRQGRPPNGCLSSFSPLVRQRLDEWRPGPEGWGAETLRVELEDEVTLQGESLPSVRSINGYLKTQGRVRPYGKPSTVPTEERQTGRLPHDVWQLDAEGNKELDPLGMVSFINIKDTHSKTYVIGNPVFLASAHSHPTRLDYQQAIRLGWMRFGLNNTFQFDHESIFFDNTHSCPYPTPLCLWLVGMGIKISYTPKGKPYKQGAVERSHQTLDRQICQGKSFRTPDELWQAALERCDRLNQRIPCRSLEHRPPLVAFPQAKHSGKPYTLTMEPSYFDQQRIKDYLAKCKPWFRTVTANRVVSLGAQKYFLCKAKAGEELQIVFNLDTELLEFRNKHSELIGTHHPKGINYDELKGQLETLETWVQQRPELFGQGADTTFLHNN